MGIEQAIARLTLMLEKGQPKNNKALDMAIRALEEKKTGEWIKRGVDEADAVQDDFLDDQHDLDKPPEWDGTIVFMDRWW